MEDVLARPMEDRAGRDGSRIALGQTEAGRYLRVIYVPDPTPGSVFVITAYELGEKARRPCGGARSRQNGRSHEETEPIPARLEQRTSATGSRSLRGAVRHRGCGRGRGVVPINDDDRDENTGQAVPAVRALLARARIHERRLGWGRLHVRNARRAGIYLAEGDQGQLGTWVWIGVEDVGLLAMKRAGRKAPTLSAETDLIARRTNSWKQIHRSAGPVLAFRADAKLNRRPPAEADFQRYFDVTAPSVHNMIMTLERRGLIKRAPGRPRSIEVLVPLRGPSSRLNSTR